MRLQFTWKAVGKTLFWNGKNILICGGSTGLGLSVAERVVQQGCGRVYLLGRSMEKLDAAKDHLKRHNPAGKAEIESLLCDLCDFSQVQGIVHGLQQASVELDLVVQSAGMSDRGSLADLSRDRLIELVDANVTTSLHTIQGFSPLLQQRHGSMILVGSLSSFFAPRYLGGYSLAKHALAALAQQARLELADSGVKVSLVCPGPIRRADSGTRYLSRSSESVPGAALAPGGGAKLKGLDADWVASQILNVAVSGRPLLILPKKAWWLRLVTACWQSLGERILRNRTS